MNESLADRDGPAQAQTPGTRTHGKWRRRRSISRGPAESRRVKAIGLLLMVAGGAALGFIGTTATSAGSFTLQQWTIWLSAGFVAANVIAVGGMVLRAGFGRAGAGRRGHTRVLALQLTAANLAAPALVWIALRDDRALEQRLADAGWEVWPDLVSLGLVIVAWRLWRRSRQHETISADEALARDPRSPIVYLRSFRDDGEMVSEGGTPVYWLLRASGGWSDEETMAGILDRLGPVIAVGKPGEPLPELGAARLYVAHDQWQERVRALMQLAQLVVIRVGSSRGVWWEIEQALARVPRQRLVLALLEHAAAERATIESLTSLIGDSIEEAWLETRPRTWRTLMQGQTNRRLGSLVWFTPEGNAKVVSVQRPVHSSWSIRHLTDRVRVHGALDHAWDEVLVNLGLITRDRPLRRSRVLAVGLAVLLGAIGAHWFYLGHRRRGWIYVAMLPLLLLPMFISFADAVRFVLADTQEFEARWVNAR
jgi:hypothetical protein